MFKHLLILMLVCPPALAQTPWLTVMGDPAKAEVDAIEVDPIPVAVTGDYRTMRVRVSRSWPRTNWDGIRYRSYQSTVMFDCASNTARYLEISFYLQPRWLGEAHRAASYPPTMPRWMLFGGVEPNPYQRIIHAACGALGRK